MEKEQKKLLLVAVSVGVFLLVTITVAIILLTQRTQPQEAAVSWNAPPPVQIQPVSPPIVEAPVTDSNESASTDINNGESLIIHIPSPTTAAVPDNPEIVAVAPAKPATAPVSPPTTAAKSSSPAKPATANAAKKTTAAKPAPSKTINDYWIQTGAFSAKVRAEDAKETLAEKGLVSIIETREVNGQVLYRVRLGPYTSQREADYWLTLVKSIDGFGESQVRQTTRQM